MASATAAAGRAAAAPAFEIVDACAADAECLTNNNCLMAKETEGLELPRETCRRGVDILLSEPGRRGHYYVVKDDDGKVIAQLMITFEWSEWRAADIWWIQSVYVHPDHRKKGLFRALYLHAKARSREAGACGVRLYVDDGNVKATDTYRSLGMTSHYRVYEDMSTSY